MCTLVVLLSYLRCWTINSLYAIQNIFEWLRVFNFFFKWYIVQSCILFQKRTVALCIHFMWTRVGNLVKIVVNCEPTFDSWSEIPNQKVESRWECLLVPVGAHTALTSAVRCLRLHVLYEHLPFRVVHNSGGLYARNRRSLHSPSTPLHPVSPVVTLSSSRTSSCIGRLGLGLSLGARIRFTYLSVYSGSPHSLHIHGTVLGVRVVHNYFFILPIPLIAD